MMLEVIHNRASSIDPVEDGYDHLAVAYDGSFKSLRCRIEDRLLTVMLNDVDLGKAVLDIGCGTGAFLRLTGYPERQYTGFDLSSGMLREARKLHPRASFKQGTVETMPFDDDSFSAVVSLFSALSYVSTPIIALREIRRVLRPGGRCFLMVNAPRWHYRNPQACGDLHLLTAPHAWGPWQARGRLRRAGLAAIRLSAFSMLPTLLLPAERLPARLWPGAGRYLIMEAERPA